MSAQRNLLQRARPASVLEPFSRPGSFCGCLWLPGNFRPIPQALKLLSGQLSAQPVAFSSVLLARGLAAQGAALRPRLTVMPVSVSSESQTRGCPWHSGKNPASLRGFSDGKPELCCPVAPCSLRNVRQLLSASQWGLPASKLCKRLVRGTAGGTSQTWLGRGCYVRRCDKPPKPSSIIHSSIVCPLVHPLP